jgi:hypothetical protein
MCRKTELPSNFGVGIVDGSSRLMRRNCTSAEKLKPGIAGTKEVGAAKQPDAHMNIKVKRALRHYADIFLAVSTII